MATSTMAMAGLWGKHGNCDGLDGAQAYGQTRGRTENVKCKTTEGISNLHSSLPGLTEFPRRTKSEIPRRSRGGRRIRESIHRREKKTDNEFDMVIVPSDGCYMSGSDSDDSDWSVGWFEPHPADFTDNEDEESFAVLVPSYVLPAPDFSTNSICQTEEKDQKSRELAVFLASTASHSDPESQRQVDSWLASLRS